MKRQYILTHKVTADTLLVDGQPPFISFDDLPIPKSCVAVGQAHAYESDMRGRFNMDELDRMRYHPILMLMGSYSSPFIKV